MNETKLMAVLAVLLAAGCRGPAGPVDAPPHIASISPTYGSPHTIFTIAGDHFAANAADDLIAVDGTTSPVTIFSASATEIRFAVDFDVEPGAAARPLPVTVEVGNQVSAPVQIFGLPSGAIHDAGIGRQVFGYANWIAADAFAIYVADPNRGLFAQNRATGVITPLALVGQDGIGVVAQVYRTPEGKLMIVQQAGAGQPRWLLMTRDESGGWSANAELSAAPIAIAFGDKGDRYVAFSSTIWHLLADGSWDPAFSVPAIGTFGGVFYQGSYLYATIPAANKVVRISSTGAATDWVTAGLATPMAITGDGTSLFVADSVSIQKIVGQTASLFTSSSFGAAYGSIRNLVPSGAGPLLVSLGSTGFVMQLDSQLPPAIVASGAFRLPFLSRSGSSIVTATWQCASVGTRSIGGLLALSDVGPARFVSGDYCVDGLVNEGRTVLVLDESHQVTRVAISAKGTKPATLAGPADGLVLPLGLAKSGDTIYVVDNVSAQSRAQVTTIAGDGTVHVGVATIPWSSPLTAESAAVSGRRLYTVVQGSGPASGVYAMSLDESPFGERLTRITDPALSASVSWDGLAAGPGGGVLLANSWGANVLLVAPDGTTTVVSNGILPTAAVERDPASGNVLCDNEDGATYLRIPFYELMP